MTLIYYTDNYKKKKRIHVNAQVKINVDARKFGVWVIKRKSRKRK